MLKLGKLQVRVNKFWAQLAIRLTGVGSRDAYVLHNMHLKRHRRGKSEEGEGGG